MQKSENAAEVHPTLWQDIGLCLVIVGAGAFSGFNIAKLAPALRLIGSEFGLSLSQLGLLASLLSLMTVCFGLLIGTMVPGFGAKRMLIFALIAGLTGSAITAFGGTTSSLFVGRIIEGFALIATMIVGPALLGQHTNPKRRGIIMGFWGGFMPFGNASALLFAPIFLASGYWQSLWYAGMSAGILLLGLVWFVVPSEKTGLRLQADTQSVKRAILMPAIGVAGLIFAAHALVYQTLLQFLPLFLVEDGGVKASLAAFLGGCFCLINFAGNVFAGRLLDKQISPFLIISATYILVGGLISIITLLEGQFALLSLVLLVIGFLTGAAPSILFYLVSRGAPTPRQIPVFMAWMLQIQGLGMLLGPSVVSSVVDMSQSWVTGFYLIAGVCFFVPVLSHILRRLYAPLQS